MNDVQFTEGDSDDVYVVYYIIEVRDKDIIRLT